MLDSEYFKDGILFMFFHDLNFVRNIMTVFVTINEQILQSVVKMHKKSCSKHIE